MIIGRTINPTTIEYSKEINDKEIIEKIKANGNNLSNFLEMFAEPVKYSNFKEKLQPSALLVFYGLIETHYCPRKTFNISKINKLIVTHQN